MSTPGSPVALPRVLGPIQLWAIAVGLVISGDYFGWNYGLEKAGPVGMIIATGFVTVLYLCFIFSYTELSSAIPSSGGPFAFAARALGPRAAAIAAAATLVEFVFAPPAIARAIGSYVHFRVPTLPINAVALGAFAVFGLVNVLGVSIAATFELIVTALAAFELGLFFVLTAPHIESARVLTEPLLPMGWPGVFAALPFAIWFYLGMEGVAMSAEEVRDPERNIPRSYIAGILTLVVLAVGTLVCTTGVLDWHLLYADDSPLPKALASVLSPDHPLTHMMIYLGLFGLIASFHGIVMGASRQLFALGRAELLPGVLAHLHPKFGTPTYAIAATVGIGACAVMSEQTDSLITLSVLGAVTVYIVSMLSVFGLRQKEPTLRRPFVAPLYPILPGIALAFSAVALVAVGVSAPKLSALYAVALLIGLVGLKKRATE